MRSVAVSIYVAATKLGIAILVWLIVVPGCCKDDAPSDKERQCDGEVKEDDARDKGDDDGKRSREACDKFSIVPGSGPARRAYL